LDISPRLKLAIALDQKPRGVYALLLGSGISSAAGIPTGWDITLDLVRRLAQADGKEIGIDEAEEWYKTTFAEEPRYDALLDALTSTQTERQRLIRPYIEPSEEDREVGKKVPTAAHRAVAKLAKNGYLRMILTTNFDRLTESAVRDEGIEPEWLEPQNTELIDHSN
jgi:NAD-dependent SIR2 family protein deacetylase